jgi:hypothetical protein
MAQKPLFMSIGTLVVVIATSLSTMSAIAATLVRQPRMRSVPPTISTMRHERCHERRRARAST